VRDWPDPEVRCNKTPDSGSGHTPPRGKTKGAGGLDTKSMEAFIKICYKQGKHGTGNVRKGKKIK
jgi:hypothetical protein